MEVTEKESMSAGVGTEALETKEESEGNPPKSESKKAKDSLQGGILVSLLLAIVDYIIYSKIYIFAFGKILFFLVSLFLLVCCMVSLSSFFDWKTAKKIEKLEDEARKEEKEFSEIAPDKRALRAEKLFKLNQKELMRYYDMNIAQTKFLSGLGIIMILFGILIIIASLVIYVVLKLDIVLLIVGNCSGIIIDFVGAIFIRMYTQNIKAAVKFHSKFAESNHLLLANSIANKIENEELREQTLSDIAKEIVALK